jgi:CheY-like chemotaxis protein
VSTILYVEDEPVIADLVRRKLARLGYDVILARNAEAALRLVREARPALILLDIGLGETSADGWEVNRQLKADAAARDIPVIALTAAAQSASDRERALREGFAEHLAKPIDFDQVARIIAETLRPGGAP